jgi:flagellar biosynthesis anti-sigma factor FlgM
MRIQSYSTPPELRSSKEVARDQATSQNGGTRGTGDDGVRLSLSSRARELASGADIDQAKIARLREAVEKGTLEMNPHLIAQKIVEENG